MMVLALSVAACRGDETNVASSSTSSSGSSSSGAGGAGGTGGAGGSGGAGVTLLPIPTCTPNNAQGCVGQFGQALTSAYGRLDGTVVAVVRPADSQCPQPNSDHVVLEVSMKGSVYRAVINIQSDFGDPVVGYAIVSHALPAPAFEEGWHTGIFFDYVVDLGVHSNMFKPIPLTELADAVACSLEIGQKVAVYSFSSGGSSSHKVHRNSAKQDGAIVVDADGPSPKVLLFRFADQIF